MEITKHNILNIKKVLKKLLNLAQNLAVELSDFDH